MNDHRARAASAALLLWLAACAGDPQEIVDTSAAHQAANGTVCNVLAPAACSAPAPACHPAASGVATCAPAGARPPGAVCSTPGVPGICTAGAVCDVTAGPAQCLPLCDLQHPPSSCAPGNACVPSQIYTGFGVCIPQIAANGVVGRTITAASGGSLVHPAGARFSVPPGGLPADATVTIRDAGPMALGVGSQLFTALSRRFVVAMRGVQSCRGATLSFTLDRNLVGSPMAPIQRDGVIIGGVGDDGQLRLSRAAVIPEGDHLVATLDLCARAQTFKEFSTVAYSAHATGVAHVDQEEDPPLLRVPYYSQDSLPWCVPTALAMVMNQFDDFEGIVSNYQLAGADHQWPDEGNRFVEILDSMGVNPAVYAYHKWDADLIPSAPFTDFAKLVMSGSFGGITRGLAMSSTTTTHAFAGVGASNDYIWLHDSSGMFAGDDDIAIRMTWAEFRAQAIDTTQSEELRTLFIWKPLRPAAELTGSLVLEEGSTTSSLVYETDGGQDISHWRWDGSAWENGFVWDDPTGTLPQDGVFGQRFPLDAQHVLPGRFAYRARVANVTETERTYTVYLFLEMPFYVMDSKMTIISVPPYSWKSSLISGVLDNFTINQDGDYSLTFELWEDDQFLDVKHAGFHVGTGPLAVP